jgi:hypothetical protein
MNSYFQRMALNAIKPGGSIQPVLDPLFSPPDLATGPVSPEIHEQLTAPVPTEFTARTKPQPSPDLPEAPTLQASEPPPKQHRPAELTESPLRIPGASVPSPQENAEPIIVPRLAQKGDQQSTEEPAEPRLETTMERQVKAVEDPATNAAPSASAASVTSSSSSFVPQFPPLLSAPKQNPGPIIVRRLPENRSEQSHRGATKPQNASILKPPPKQETEGSSEQTKSDAIAVSGDFGQFTTLGTTSTGVAETSKKLGSQNWHTARSEPDEIQIHIGRIEVVAVPPATVAPSSLKPKREAPSLDEYLRRRGGRAV